jgi:signal transduction histidine kinase
MPEVEAGEVIGSPTPSRAVTGPAGTGSAAGIVPAGAASAALSDAGSDAGSQDREAAEDSRLIRRVRWRLVAWSGGSTLLVFLALGVAIYFAAASSLAASGTSALQSRIDQYRTFLTGSAPDSDRSPADFVFGSGGTIASAFFADGRVVRVPGGFAASSVIDQEAARAADASGRDVRFRTITVEGPGPGDETVVPVRQLTVPIDTSLGRVYVQALQDRTSELRTLDTLLLVLIVGGVIVVLVAIGFGAIYARRALVPIRDSLASQRLALQRQREFAADASHELRTPLTVIRASVEHLRRHADEPVAVVGDALEDIDAEVTHLTAMVGDLLLLARSDSGAISLERVPIELDDIATDAATSLRGPAEARGVRLVVDPEPAPGLGDPVRLRQLVTALIDNAIRYSPPGSEVRIEVRREGAGEALHLSVEDQGTGIRPEDLPRIFDRFWRAQDAPSGGTGLGLAIAKWIAERHDGRIVASNRSGGGARFEVELPARPAGGQSTGGPTA